VSRSPYRSLVEELVDLGVSHEPRHREWLEDDLPRHVSLLLRELDHAAFLDFLKSSDEWSFVLHEATGGGVCAKPTELSAWLMEALVTELVEERIWTSGRQRGV
jgi:hypothetical protein